MQIAVCLIYLWVSACSTHYNVLIIFLFSIFVVYFPLVFVAGFWCTYSEWGSPCSSKTIQTGHSCHARRYWQKLGQSTHCLPPVCLVTPRQIWNGQLTGHSKLLHMAYQRQISWSIWQLCWVQRWTVGVINVQKHIKMEHGNLIKKDVHVFILNICVIILKMFNLEKCEWNNCCS